ncbi:MAG: YqaA family protein [bacterium]|nr:YqaA family protein [bacterium]
MISIVIITYLTLFAASFLAATILPLSPDLIAAKMALDGNILFYIIAVAAIGSYLGSCTTYYLGYLGREKILKKRPEKKEGKMEKYHKIFERYGAPILLLTWVPIVGDIFAGIAGVLEINFWVFSLYALLGKIIRFTFVVYLAEKFI